MREHKNIKYWTETSAKSGENVELLFLNASKFLYSQMLDNEESNSGSDIGATNSQMGGSHMGSHP